MHAQLPGRKVKILDYSQRSCLIVFMHRFDIADIWKEYLGLSLYIRV